MFSPGSILFTALTDHTTLPPGTPTGAFNGTSINGSLVQLGQLLAAVGDPGKLLHPTEIPMNSLPLILSGIGAGLAQLILRDDAAAGAVLQFVIEDSAGVAKIGIFADPLTDSFYITNVPPPGLTGAAVHNIVIGRGALQQNISGSRTIAIGEGAGQNDATLTNWIIIGNDAVDNGGVSIGGAGIVIGQNSFDFGGGAIGDNLICLGSFTNNSIGGNVGDNVTVIGNSIGISGGAAHAIYILSNSTGAATYTLSNVVVIGDDTQNTIFGNPVGTNVDSGDRVQINGNVKAKGIKLAIRTTAVLAEAFGADDYTILADTTAGNMNINIDPTTHIGSVGNIKKISGDVNTVTLTALSGLIFDLSATGAATFSFNFAGENIQFQSDGINIYIL